MNQLKTCVQCGKKLDYVPFYGDTDETNDFTEV